MFAFFAYDDILPYLMAWYIYYPVMGVLIFIAVSLAVGNNNMIFDFGGLREYLIMDNRGKQIGSGPASESDNLPIVLHKPNSNSDNKILNKSALTPIYIYYKITYFKPNS